MYSYKFFSLLSFFPLSGVKWIQRAVLLWIQDPAGRDASLVRKALSGDVIDPKGATEVICSRTPSQIQHFKQVYFAKFGVYLEQDIELQTFGDHKKVPSLTFHDFDSSYLPSIVT